MEITDLAGLIATILFASSNLPTLRKAVRSRDLHSYSLGGLLLVNAGNLIYTLYVLTLPRGPVWALHAFYLIASVTMLALYLRTGTVNRSVGDAGHGSTVLAGHRSNGGS